MKKALLLTAIAITCSQIVMFLMAELQKRRDTRAATRKTMSGQARPSGVARPSTSLALLKMTQRLEPIDDMVVETVDEKEVKPNNSSR